MKLREHRGNWAESMKTQAEIPNTLEALCGYISAKLAPYSVTVRPEDITVRKYPMGLQDSSWKGIYIVSVQGYGVFGFISEPLEAG